MTRIDPKVGASPLGQGDLRKGRKTGRNSSAFALGLLLLTLGFSGFAKTIYVSPSGDNRNPGTEEAPLRMIANAVTMAEPGDIILLRDGTYGSEGLISDGSGGWNGYASPVVIRKAGTPEAWITIRAEHKGQARLDCENTEARRGCDVYIYLRDTAAYWSFEDLVITRAAFAGINTNEGAHHIRIVGCDIGAIGNHNEYGRIGIVGIGFAPETASNWSIEDNLIHNIGRIDGQRNLDHGIYAGGADATIVRNVFYSNQAGWHIQTTRGAKRWLIANNTFAGPGSSNGHIMLWDGDLGGSIGDIEIRDNIFYNVRGSAIVSYARSLPNCMIENNLTTASRIFDQRTTCAERANRLETDPKFVNGLEAPFDFRLELLSPALGSATDGADLGAIRTLLGLTPSK